MPDNQNYPMTLREAKDTIGCFLLGLILLIILALAVYGLWRWVG